MVIKKDRLKTARINNACRGDGYMDVTKLVEEEAARGRLKALDIYTLEENCALGKHFHVGESVLLYCISGSGWLDGNGEKVLFEQGDAARFKSGEFYSLRNADYHVYEQQNRAPLVVLAGLVRDEHTKPDDAPPLIGLC